MIRSLTIFALLFVGAFAFAQEHSLPCCNCEPARESADVICLSSDQIRGLVLHIEPLQPSGLDKDLKLAGTLKIEVRLGADGKVECVRAIEGNPIAISAAIQALPKWKFKPFVQARIPRSSCGQIQIRYRLSNKGSSTKLQR